LAYILVADNMMGQTIVIHHSLFSSLVPKDARFAQYRVHNGCVMAAQVYPRSLILTPIDNAYGPQ